MLRVKGFARAIRRILTPDHRYSTLQSLQLACLIIEVGIRRFPILSVIVNAEIIATWIKNI
jgi:hypothetical protein